MRILYVGDSTHIHDFRFIEKLVERGYDTHVLTIDKNPIKIRGAKYYAFPLRFNEYGNRFLDDLRFIYYIYQQRKFIRRLIRMIKPDILHGGWIPKHGLLSALSGFHPFLLMPWGSDVLLLPENSSFLTRKQIIWTMKRADMITCDAQYVKEKIIELSGYPAEKIIVFPWGIDLSKFNNDIDKKKIRRELGWEDKQIIIMTRSFKAVYGIEYLLESLPELIGRNINVRVLLCGDGPLRGGFQDFIIEKGLDEYVHLAGFVKNDELPVYLSSANVYVSTSLSDGTSLSLLEAMAIGLPCIVTDLPSNKEWITDGYNGFIVPKKDSLALHNRIEYLFNNTRMGEKFGRRNSAIARDRVDWNINFGKLEDIYRELSKI